MKPSKWGTKTVVLTLRPGWAVAAGETPAATRSKLSWAKVLVALAVASFFGLCTSAQAQMLINGAGATFPYPLYSKWFDEYARVDSTVRFNYQSIGSGAGQQQI